MELHVTKRKGREIVVLLDNDMRIVKPVYDYLKYQDQRDRAINTLIAYGNDLKAFWEFLSDYGYAYDEVSPKMIGEYKEYLMSEDDNIIAINKEGARTAKTINRMLSTLHGFYQYKADMQEIDNPLLMHEVNRPFNAFKGILEHARSDNKTKQLMAARDPMGIRPMFYGYSKKEHQICFASEAKALFDLCDDIMPFPPGHYYLDGQFVCYNDLSDPKTIVDDDLETIAGKLKTKLEKAVEKRFMSDVPIGYLLSGGLDSSLVCAIGQKLSDKPIRTFAIGMESDPIDLKYAKQVADYLGTEHTEVIMNKEDLYQHLKEVIYHLETFDITTIRASMAMYILCKYIHQNTDIKVIMTGEVSDELFGYKYTDFAPNAKAFQEESSKRIKELYMYDVLRADRCISAHALEGRVPFADLDFVDYSMSIDPAKKMNVYNKGKYLLRHAFEGTDYLPHDILFREKAAFSDAVGHSMVDYLKELAEDKYSDEDVLNAKDKYSYCTPFTKESLMYRDIFESFFPQQGKWIKDFWMPNKEWENCDVDDPSARVLKNYGDSGK
jgi:asparagine synthase (glutamine-hydrolysing)